MLSLSTENCVRHCQKYLYVVYRGVSVYTLVRGLDAYMRVCGVYLCTCVLDKLIQIMYYMQYIYVST